MATRIISGRTTFVYKKLLPVIGPLFLLMLPFLAFDFRRFHINYETGILLAIFVISGMLLAGILFKRAYCDLMDEVEDLGDRLIIRNNGEQDVVLFTNIVGIDFPKMSGNFNPDAPPVPRITLHLLNPCRFGQKVSFLSYIAPLSTNWSKTVDELRERVAVANGM
jgi:hypothetical protein